MSRKPVDSNAYDKEWIASAWGKQRNEQLLNGKLRPRPRVRRAMALAAIQPGHMVLDIACGRGEVPAIAAQMGAHAIGIDYSAAALEFALKVRTAQHIGANKFGSIELVRGDACLMPFCDNSFDRITALDIVEHLTREQLGSMLKEMRRLLKPDGFAVIHTLPNRWVYDITFPLLRRLIRRLPSDPRGAIEKLVHINEQDLPRLHRMLSACGLNHRLWLEQHITAQARWNTDNDRYGDNRDTIYPVLLGPAGRVLELLSLTPLKFFLSNDIFGLAWNGNKPAAAKLPFAVLDRLVCLLPVKNKP